MHMLTKRAVLVGYNIFKAMVNDKKAVTIKD